MADDKAVGQQGSWFATVGDEILPCVRDHWWIKRTSRYHDPYGRPDGGGQWDEFAAALRRGGRAILTNDRVIAPDPDIKFERLGYIAIFEVANVALDENGLRFDFVRRARNFR